MTVFVTYVLVVALAFALGLAYFWSVAKTVEAWSRGWTASALVHVTGRVLVAATVFLALARRSWVLCVIALVGFVAARMVAVRRMRPS